MARVTVEDCIEKVSNRFELVMLAAQRARSLSSGAELTIERDNDKNPVIALREIADETVELNELEENLIKGLQTHVEPDEPDEEEMDMLTAGDESSETFAQNIAATKAEEGEEVILAFTDNIFEGDEKMDGDAD